MRTKPDERLQLSDIGKATPVAALTLWDLLGLGAPCDAAAVAARCAAI
jgi:hypothetical protein